VPAAITIYEDRSHDFLLKTPPTAALLRRTARLQGAGPGACRRSVTRAQLRTVAEAKLPTSTATTSTPRYAVVAGTARSMGLRIEG
jgi:large subunit ribosomal protein L11